MRAPYSTRLSVAAFLFTVSLPAQVDRATLSGLVSDASGSVVPAVRIEVVLEATGLRREAISSDSGLYLLPGLPIGSYTVTASRDGFKTVRFKGIDLGVGQRRSLDITLEVGAIATQVDVQDTAAPLEKTSAELGSVVHSRQLQQIPLNGRHWASLMALAPGAINTGEGNQSTIRFVGRAYDDNNWTFDGVDSTGVKDPRQEGLSRLVISTDSIAEFRVSSTLYTAESGTAAGAQINVVSKSGTNQFHGSLFHFLRNSALDARGPFDGATLPPFRLNQFGANLGGPIVKNKTFFYLNFEGLRQRLAQTFVGFVPSAAFKTRAIAASPSLRPLLEAFPAGQSSQSADIDRLARPGRQSWGESSGMLRLDHRFSDLTSMFFRYTTDDGLVDEPRNVLLDRRSSDFRPSNAALQLQRIFSPSLIYEVKAAVNRSVLRRSDTSIFPESFSVPGFQTPLVARDVLEAGTSYSVINNLSLVRGSHTFKMGYEARRINVNVGNSPSVSGVFASREDLVRNRVDNVSIAGELATRGTRRTYHLAFVQDEWKIRQNLTLNVGLRYEYYTVINEILGRGKVFDIIRCQGFCAPGTPFYFPDRNNFDPRVSLAWSPAALGGKTVLRAGFGLYHGTGQNDDVTPAIDSDAERFSLTVREVAALSYPLGPFLRLAQSIGFNPRSLQRDRRDLYSTQWGFSVQQQLPLSFALQASYLGSNAHQLFGRSWVNVIDPATNRRPLTQFGRVEEKHNQGNSNFQALQLSLHRSFTRGWLWGAEYMWSHSINDNSIGAGEGVHPQNVNCRRCERADSNTDIRHTITMNSVYELPVGPGRRYWRASGVGGRLLEGWELSGVGTARTGRPVTVMVTRSSASVPDGNNANQRPNVVPGVSLIPPGGRTIGNWINPAAFSVPANGTWGNAGRSLLRGPGMWQFDLGITKRTYFSEHRALEFRFESFNLFNRPQFGDPAADLAALPTFGRIVTPLNTGVTGVGTARQLQFMLRFRF